MRRDIIIGILASVLFHVGFLYGSEIFKSSGKKTAQVEVETPRLALMKMPEVEQEEPEPSTDTSETTTETTKVDFAPPAAADMPQTIAVDSFVQKVQPPPPEGVKANATAMVIPTTRPTQAAKTMGQVFNLADLDQKPVARNRVPPNYPFDLKRQGITGEVVVGFICDSNGDVRDPYIISSTQREFEGPALQAIQKWKFRPGKKGGKAVNSRMSQPFNFSLNE